jgi:hypothetical protein
MHLFAAGPLSFTTEQLLASALVGVSAVVVYNGVMLIRKSRKIRAEMSRPTADADDGEPVPATKPEKPMSPLAGVLVLVLGVAMLIGGMVWRFAAEE